MPGEHGLDLPQLDAEAAHLTWWSTRPRNSIARRAASAPGRRCGRAARRAPPPKGSGTKRSAVRSGRPQVAAAPAGAADVQLARHAGGHRLQAAVEQVERGLAIGRPMGTAASAASSRSQAPGRSRPPRPRSGRRGCAAPHGSEPGEEAPRAASAGSASPLADHAPQRSAAPGTSALGSRNDAAASRGRSAAVVTPRARSSSAR